MVWSMPLSMMLVMICLLKILGPSVLVGLFVLLISVPIMKQIAAKIQSIRHSRAKVTDKRVEVINAMLLGVSRRRIGKSVRESCAPLYD